MKTNTKLATCKRTVLSKLISKVIGSTADRQPDLTELMLYEIEKHGIASETTGILPKNPTYRITNDGNYFTTGDGNSEKPQLAECAKIRLTESTGGTIKRAKDKKGNMKVVNGSLYSGAFSEQDFRRCFDFVKAHSDWSPIKLVEGDEEKTYFIYVVNSDSLNHSMRIENKRWDNLSYAHVGNAKQKDSRDGNVSVSVSNKDKPGLQKDKSFLVKRNAKSYYVKVLKHIGKICRDGGLKISIKIDNESIL